MESKTQIKSHNTIILTTLNNEINKMQNIIFDSNFDSGNLQKAEKIANNHVFIKKIK